MVIREVEVEVYGIAVFCDCGEPLENGELKRQKVKFTCKKCGKEYDLDENYPLVRYRLKY